MMTPFTPQKRDNMIAWLAARCDFPDYGKDAVLRASERQTDLWTEPDQRDDRPEHNSSRNNLLSGIRRDRESFGESSSSFRSRTHSSTSFHCI
jgi:uncharacterized membrane protein (UPF0182 family)